jgi:hypothetical protein
MRHLTAALAALSMMGCSAFWPTIVRESPDEPLFRSGFPLMGVARIDGALCSLATVGPEATRLVSPPESLAGAVSPEAACAEPDSTHWGARGRSGILVRVETSLGPFFGYLYRVGAPVGIVVAFSGMGMPPYGWVNQEFAEQGAKRDLLMFAAIRDESSHPIVFDPLREALRAVEAIPKLRAACGVAAEEPVGFIGISLGGMEALLANREALAAGLRAKAAVLDPLLDPDLAASNLDSTWHSISVDSMQAYFRRILAGRYQERPPPSFHEVLNRVSTVHTTSTVLTRDAPSKWLCQAPRDAYSIFLSETDPVLGDAQREFAKRCDWPLKPAGVPGHTPLACNLDLFESMIKAVARQGHTPLACNLDLRESMISK